jgi:hypothetical protein
MKHRLEKYKTYQRTETDSMYSGSSLKSNTFFSKQKKYSESQDSQEEASQSYRQSKRESYYQTTAYENVGSKITAQELQVAKNRLSHIPSRGNQFLQLSASLRNLAWRSSGSFFLI